MAGQLITFLLLTAPIAGPHAKSAANNGRVVQIVASHSGKCLQTASHRQKTSDNVEQATCDANKPEQQWRLRLAGGDWLEIISIANGRCLDVGGESASNGANVIVFPCKGQGRNRNQLWKLEAPRRGKKQSFQLIAQHSSSCLEIAASATNDGANASQHSCAGRRQRNQHFSLRDVQVTRPPAIIAGTWRWFNQINVTIHADGTMFGDNNESGTWQQDGKNLYVLHWKAGWVDRLRLSSDHNELRGQNQHGTQVSGTRVTVDQQQQSPAPASPPPAPKEPQAARDCGTGADDPGCQTAKDGRFAMEAAVYKAILQNAQSESNAFNRRDLILTIAQKHLMTARQYTSLLELFANELNRLEVARALAPQLVDPANALAYAAKFNNSFNKRDYNDLIGAQL